MFLNGLLFFYKQFEPFFFWNYFYLLAIALEFLPIGYAERYQ